MRLQVPEGKVGDLHCSYATATLSTACIWPRPARLGPWSCCMPGQKLDITYS